jgi:predicted nucleic acid-binding protein
MFLLDTNVISELRKPRSTDQNVIRWASGIAAGSLYLSVVTILEIELGMLQIARRDPLQADLLRAWIEDQILPEFAGRILQIDVQIARRTAALHVPNRRPERDAIIAATALVHRMTVVTRNVDDFVPTGVRTLNPWEAL